MRSLYLLVVIVVMGSLLVGSILAMVLAEHRSGPRKPRTRHRLRLHRHATVASGVHPIHTPHPRQEPPVHAPHQSARPSGAGPESGRLLDPPPPGPDGPPPAAPAAAPAPTAAPEPAPAPSTSRPAVSTVEKALVPEQAVAPRFVPGSRASQMPWLLPMESASPSGVAADQARLRNLEVRAASVIGAGHRCEEPVKPRQDAYRVARDRTGRHLVVAVADGMSDSARSELGASVAVATAVALVRRHLDGGKEVADLRARELFGEVSDALVQAARDRRLDPADVRTTLAVAVLPAYHAAKEVATAWVAQIADTHLWRLDDDGWQCLTGGAKDTYDGSVLDAFLPHRPEAARGATFDFAGDDTVAVLSDGVADAFAEVSGAGPWFAERWRRPPPLASFVLDVDFEAKGLQDDRTAVVVWAGHQPATGGAARR